MSLEKWGPRAGWLVSIAAAVTLAYNVGLRAGWFVDEAGAQVMIATGVASEEYARLDYILETKRAQLRMLQRIEQPTAADRQEIADLQDAIRRIRDRMDELRKQGAAL